MTVSNVGSSTQSSSINQMTNSMDAYRSADFMKIILSEITNQDPLNPTETSKMVESMQSLQNLANSTYQSFRQDIAWAQSLVGSTVNVTQVGATDAQLKGYKDAGLNIDAGYGNLDGKIESFKVVNQSVWVSINGKDYPASNVKQVRSDAYDTSSLVDNANRLLGMTVKYTDSTGASKQGTVSSVGFDSLGKVQLGVGSAYIYPSAITAITVPAAK